MCQAPDFLTSKNITSKESYILQSTLQSVIKYIIENNMNRKDVSKFEYFLAWSKNQETKYI